MIKSKGIRILCYVAMGLSYFLAIILLICGCSALVDEKISIGIGLLLIAILIPFSVTLSLYPIFALSLIESNVSELTTTIEQLSAKLVHSSPTPPPQSHETPNDKNCQNPPLTPTPPMTDAIDFINQKYNIQIDVSDDLITIQEKISKIKALDNLTQIFVNRVINAKSFDEVCSIIKMHRSVTKNTFNSY